MCSVAFHAVNRFLIRPAFAGLGELGKQRTYRVPLVAGGHRASMHTSDWSLGRP